MIYHIKIFTPLKVVRFNLFNICKAHISESMFKNFDILQRRFACPGAFLLKTKRIGMMENRLTKRGFFPLFHNSIFPTTYMLINNLNKI
jgi:hypothetical protein